jgi:hypothetical protein
VVSNESPQYWRREERGFVAAPSPTLYVCRKPHWRPFWEPRGQNCRNLNAISSQAQSMSSGGIGAPLLHHGFSFGVASHVDLPKLKEMFPSDHDYADLLRHLLVCVFVNTTDEKPFRSSQRLMNSMRPLQSCFCTPHYHRWHHRRRQLIELICSASVRAKSLLNHRQS